MNCVFRAHYGELPYWGKKKKRVSVGEGGLESAEGSDMGWVLLYGVCMERATYQCAVLPCCLQLNVSASSLGSLLFIIKIT